MYEVYHRTPVGVAFITADDTHITKVSIRDETVEETTTNRPLYLKPSNNLTNTLPAIVKILTFPSISRVQIFSRKFGRNY
jgi:hypothetical protein